MTCVLPSDDQTVNPPHLFNILQVYLLFKGCGTKSRNCVAQCAAKDRLPPRTKWLRLFAVR